MRGYFIKTVAIGLFATTLTAGPAAAAVKYEFTGRDYSEFFDAAPSFSFILPGFASSSTATAIPGTSLTGCTVTDALLPTTCASVELRPNFFGSDSLFFYSTNQFGEGASAYNFTPGAFGALGTYNSEIQQGNGPLIKATLTVSAVATQGAVPEPATWAMMICGFGAIGGATRYRRRKTNVSFA